MTSIESIEELLAPTATPTPMSPPALTIEAREQIRAAAEVYALAVGTYEGRVSRKEPAGSADFEAARGDLGKLLDDLTTTTVNTELLERNKALTERDQYIREGEELRAQLAASNRRNAEDRHELVTQLAHFKERVAEVATRYAERHDMCSVVDDALEELGLERVKKQYRATLTITVEFTATRNAGADDELPANGWVRDSIGSSYRDSILDNFEMDDDHDGAEVDEVSFSVTNVRSMD